jgi:DNA repair exonuclease SbcCD ATPase subunit
MGGEKASVDRVPIKEAAERLGVSADTIKRRLKARELVGEKQPTAQGFIWLVEVPAQPAEEARKAEEPAGALLELAILRERLAGLERLLDERASRIAELEASLAAERDAAAGEREASAQLRILLQQAQTLAGAIPATVSLEEAKPQASPAAAPRSSGSLWDRIRGRASA